MIDNRRCLHIPSTDGVEVAVHDLTASGRPLLITHAQGFHGRCYAPLAEAMRPIRRGLGMDVRGHGDTAIPTGWTVDWEGFYADTAAVATVVGDGEPVAAFGHSMGAALLLRTAQRSPSTFAALVLYEPALFPPSPGPDGTQQLGVAMAANVRRRRATFASMNEAIDHFGSKAPMNDFTPEALRNYVEHGLWSDSSGAVHLKCAPEFEAQSYEHYPVDDFWDLLREVEVPTLVLAGTPTPFRPSQYDPLIAQRVRHGSFRRLEGLGHFGPMSHPEVVAEAISAFLDR